MTNDLEQRLRTAGTVIDREIDARLAGRPEVRPVRMRHDHGPPSAPLRRGPHARRRRERRSRALAIAASVAVLAGAGGAAALWRQAGGSDPAPVGSTPDAPLPAGWSALPPAPLEPPVDVAPVENLAISTGDGLFIWDGFAEGGVAESAYYDAESQTWRVVPDAPLAAGPSDAIGVWTGREVVVLNGVDGVRAAAFDPASFTWRELPAPGIQIAANARATLVAGGRVAVVDYPSGMDPQELPVRALILDPATGEWSAGADAPAALEGIYSIASTPDALVVVGGRDDAGCVEQAFAYDPARDSWETFDLPVSGWTPSVIARAGDRVLMAGGWDCPNNKPQPAPPQTSRAMLLDPATGEWSPAADLPAAALEPRRYEAPWTGDRTVLATAVGLPLFFDPAANTWATGTALLTGDERFWEMPLVWLDGRLVLWSAGLVWSDQEGTCCSPVAGGYAYTPPVTASGQ